jgi:hypothetical protein
MKYLPQPERYEKAGANHHGCLRRREWKAVKIKESPDEQGEHDHHDNHGFHLAESSDVSAILVLHWSNVKHSRVLPQKPFDV